MPQTLLSSTRGTQNTAVTTASATQYWHLGNGTLAPGTTETTRETIYRTAGELSSLYVRIIANTVTTGNSTVGVRKNGVSSAMSVTIVPGATGVFEYTATTETVSAADKLSYITFTRPTGTLTIAIASVIYTTDVGGTTAVSRHVTESYNVTDVSATRYLHVAGDRSGTASTETDTQSVMRVAGTAKNASTFVNANGSTNPVTFTLRKNAVDTAIVLTVPGSTPAVYEDTSNSVSFAAGDTINWKIISGSGTSNMTFQSLSVEYQTTDQNGVIVGGAVGATALTTQAANLTRYYALGGSINAGDTTEANSKQKMRITGNTTLHNLTVRSQANTVTADTTLRLRINGADGNQLITIPSGGVGFYTDTTHTDNVTATDEINYQIITGATGTTLTINQLGVFTKPAGAEITKTLSETESITETAHTRLKASWRQQP